MLRNTYNRVPEEGWAISVSKCLVLVAFCHIWCILWTFLESVSKKNSFDIHHDHKHYNATIVSPTQKCKTTKYMKLNTGKWNSRNENRPNLRNETKFYSWRNKTKRNEISLFLLFRETSEISRNNFFLSLCFVFRETKKGCEMETLVLCKENHRWTIF
jgi:hypothetical protein